LLLKNSAESLACVQESTISCLRGLKGQRNIPWYNHLGEQFQRNLPNHPQEELRDLLRTASQLSARLSQQVMVEILEMEPYTSQLDHSR
jgi:hypothetical protein